MKADAAAQRVIDRISQEMVDIYREPQQQQQIALPPALPEEQRNEQCGNEKMQRDMKNDYDSRVAALTEFWSPDESSAASAATQN